jgi:hypothetical protein
VPLVRVFFSFSFVFIDSNLLVLFYLDSIDIVKEWRGLRWAATTKRGPNDARCVVWAPRYVSFFFFCITNYYLHRLRMETTARDEEDGERDRDTRRGLGSRRICISSSRYFFYFLFRFYIFY